MLNIKIQLPGTEKQLEFLQKNLTSKIDTALVIGSASERCAEHISRKYSCKAEVIVNDYNSLINSKLILGNTSNIDVRLMEFDVTDFSPAGFDLVYAQASISLINRNKIVRELHRILKPHGYFCVGEIVALKKDYPVFIKDIIDSSNIKPLFVEDVEKYYDKNDFKLISKEELNSTMKEYYERVALLKKTKNTLNPREKSYYKKTFNRISHESNAYLKLGGNKYLGFVCLFLQRGNS